MKLLLTKNILYTISHKFLIFSDFSSWIKNVAFYFSKHESLLWPLAAWIRVNIAQIYEFYSTLTHPSRWAMSLHFRTSKCLTIGAVYNYGVKWTVSREKLFTWGLGEIDWTQTIDRTRVLHFSDRLFKCYNILTVCRLEVKPVWWLSETVALRRLIVHAVVALSCLIVCGLQQFVGSSVLYCCVQQRLTVLVSKQFARQRRLAMCC